MRDFSQAPFLVIWEVTRACDLACVHCRASADPVRHLLELSTDEGFALLEHSVRIGLKTTLSPSPTPLLTGAAIAGFKGAGVSRISVSVDGPDAASHDGFRQVPGSFERALFALEEARRGGLSTQVNTTEARHYRRYATQRRKAEGNGRGQAEENPLNRMAGINSGRGFVFISRTGEIYPSGFLPISAGNVRRHSLVDVYRGAALFHVLRDPSALRGKCGLCQYRHLCGASRSRAYALTGDYLAEEPPCLRQSQPLES